MISQKGGFFMFLRAQLSAQMATIADFLVTILLVRLFEVYYVYATLAGAVYGGIVNCVINYKWTFKSTGKKTNVALFWNYNMHRFFVYRNINIGSLFRKRD